MNLKDFKVHKFSCKYCASEHVGKSQEHSEERIKNAFLSRGYEYISKYKSNKRTFIEYKCNNHLNVIQKIDYGSFNQGHGCPYCFYDRNSRENHSCWKGGFSNITQILRMAILPWTKKSFITCNNKCVLTGYKGKEKVVHHIKSFNTILEETFSYFDENYINEIKDLTNFEDDKLKEMKDKIIENHNQLGVCLSVDMHKLFHSNYGYGNNTQKQFLSFISDLESGKFDDILKEKNITLNINKELMNSIIVGYKEVLWKNV